MNYKSIHDRLIARARERETPLGYTERHHVIPKSMGGSDGKENIVVLTAREHYLVHWLLYKIHRNRAMAFAWFRLTHRGNSSSGSRYISRTFVYARKARARAASERFSGRKLSDDHRKKLSEAKLGKTYAEIGRVDSPLRGRACSEEHRAKVAAASVGRRHSEEAKRKCALAKLGQKNHRFGVNVPAHTRQKLSAALKGKKRPDARRLGPRNTSGVVGVHWEAARRRWYASISVGDRSIYLGRFETKEAAIAARLSAEGRLLA